MPEQNPIFRPHRFCIAPMLDWTDRHCRFFLRLISQDARLYTEMVTASAIIHGDETRLLSFNEEEHPVALQLGGSNPADLAKACQIAARYHYDEINLNVGCPSDRVQSGQFGACLMLQPDRVAECFKSMADATSCPITIKCRTGVDEFDSLEFLETFIETLIKAGCTVFIIHARKAWLQGLSPKQNREIPPLEYEKVHNIKARYPDIDIIINGGIKNLSDCKEQLSHCDGVMIGREAYQNPYSLASIDQKLFNKQLAPLTRQEIIKKTLIYIEKELSRGVKLNHISRHILGLYNGQKGAKAFRRHISENAHKPNAGTDVILSALHHVDDRI